MWIVRVQMAHPKDQYNGIYFLFLKIAFADIPDQYEPRYINTVIEA